MPVRCTLTVLLGGEDNVTPNAALFPPATVRCVRSATTEGCSTPMATGSEVVLWPCLSVVTAVSE